MDYSGLKAKKKPPLIKEIMSEWLKFAKASGQFDCCSGPQSCFGEIFNGLSPKCRECKQDYDNATTWEFVND